jgi:hypothetical protein
VKVKQAVLVFCPLNDIQKDDKTSTYKIGNTWSKPELHPLVMLEVFLKWTPHDPRM